MRTTPNSHRTHTGHARQAIIALAIVSSIGAGCAARSPVARVQVGALAVGEAVLGFDQVERQLYQGNVYDKATHDSLGAVILKTLYAARAYERAAVPLVEGQPLPATVTDALAGVQAALADLEKAIPAVTTARDPLLRALAAIRAAIAAVQTTQAERPQLVLAQAPGGGIFAIFAFLNILGSLIQTGRTTITRLRDILAKEGATPEELASMDAALSEAIAAREQELGGGG